MTLRWLMHFGVISKHALLQERVPSNFDLVSRGDHSLLEVKSSKHLLALRTPSQHHSVEHKRIIRLMVNSSKGDRWFDWKMFSDSRSRERKQNQQLGFGCNSKNKTGGRTAARRFCDTHVTFEGTAA
jgi:hypothetical protein